MTAILLLFGCGEPELPVGDWLAGDLHVHSSVGSNDTDGLGTVEALAPVMEARGLDFLFITDHSNSAGSMDCEDVEDCPNQGPELSGADWPEGVFEGNEISPILDLESSAGPCGHVGCLPLNGDDFPDLDHWEDRPDGAVSGGDAVDQCVKYGGWAIVNHPYALASWIEFDWSSEAYSALEVYNGGSRFDPWDAETVVHWEEELAAGRSTVPVGGSDSHRWGTEPPGDTLNPALGWPTTWVHQREGESPIDALVAGRTVIAEPGSELSLVAIGKRSAVGPGETITGPVRLRLEGEAELSGLELQLVRIGQGVVWSAEPGEPIEHEADSGRYYARLWPQDEVQANQGGVALTNAITVIAGR